MIFLQGLGGICSAKSDEHLKTKLFDIESQILHIYRMVDVGWDLWRSPSLTRLLRTVSQEAVQDSVHLGFEYFQGWSLYSLSRKQVWTLDTAEKSLAPSSSPPLPLISSTKVFLS